MKYRRLPRTDLDLSEVGFSVWTVSSRDWGLDSPGDGARLLQKAFDLGITYFQTTDVIDNGDGERILREALPGRRHDMAIATTVGYDWHTDPLERPAPSQMEQRWTHEYLRKAIESSLWALDTDYIDLYLLHHPSMDALEDDGIFDFLETVQTEGKVRYWGISVRPGPELEKEASAAIQERSPQAMEVPFSILEQEPGGKLLSAAARNKVGAIVRDPLARGALDGTLAFPARTVARPISAGLPAPVQPPDIQRLSELEFIHEQYEMTLAQGALKFALAQPGVCSVVPEILRPVPLDVLAAVPDLREFDPQDMQRLRELFRPDES